MPQILTSNVERSWEWPEGCLPLPFGSAALSTDWKTLRRSADRVICCSWLGPVTDRARVEIATCSFALAPSAVRLVLSSTWGDPSESWDLATATVPYATVPDAAGFRPVLVTAGIPTRRWTLYAWLDAASMSEEALFRAEVIVDRGGSGAPFIARATGVLA